MARVCRHLLHPRHLCHRHDLPVRLHVLHLAEGFLGRVHLSAAVLPYEPETVNVDGEPLPLFTVESDEGEMRSMVLVESGVEAGLFALPSDLETTIAVPLEFAADTGQTTDVDGEPLPIYTVTFQGETQDLVLLRGTAVGRFVDPDDPTVEGYEVVRTAGTIRAHHRALVELRRGARHPQFRRRDHQHGAHHGSRCRRNPLHFDHGWVHVSLV